MGKPDPSEIDTLLGMVELSARAELARKQGRSDDADELEQRLAGYRDELADKR
ncbi:MAG: hypothetical protein HY239_17210 [Mycolicibacterium aromaticivorans]|nr:hypothetical protein [Mycolicibacterium aromaticivorans]